MAASIKFSKIPAHFEVCTAWQDHGLISEDGLTVFTSAPLDRARILSAKCPLECLKLALKQYALSPMWEECGGHFKRLTRDAWRGEAAQNRLFGEGGIFEKLEGGWMFSGNFSELSLGFSMETADPVVAAEILDLMAANYSSDKYKKAASQYYGDKLAGCEVYARNNGSLIVATPREVSDIEDFDRLTNQRRINIIERCFMSSTRVGSRSEIDLGEWMRENIEELKNK